MVHHYRVAYIHITHAVHEDPASLFIDPMGYGILDILVDAATMPHLVVGKLTLILAHYIAVHASRKLNGD